jgi:hypothetical protein
MCSARTILAAAAAAAAAPAAGRTSHPSAVTVMPLCSCCFLCRVQLPIPAYDFSGYLANLNRSTPRGERMAAMIEVSACNLSLLHAHIGCCCYTPKAMSQRFVFATIMSYVVGDFIACLSCCAHHSKQR